MSDQPTPELPVDPLGSRDLLWKQKWLAENWDKRGTSGSELNWWRAFAWVADRQARELNDLQWAAIATQVYDWLDTQWTGGAAFEGMTLRVAMIAALGPQPGDPTLDPQRIIDWFHSDLALTPGQATWMYVSRSELTHEQWATLVKLRAKIGVIEELAKLGIVTISQDLQFWIQIKNSLPVAMYF